MGAPGQLRAGLCKAALLALTLAALALGAPAALTAGADAASGRPATAAPTTAAQHERAAKALERRRRLELRADKRCRRAAARAPRRSRARLLRRARGHRSRARRLAARARRHRQKAARLRRAASRPAASAPATAAAVVRRAPIPLGTAISWRRFRDEPALQSIFEREFGQLTPENELKWNALRPARDLFDFTVADQMVDYATARGKRVRGHTLVWGNQNPRWLTHGDWTRETLLAVMQDHIGTVMGRYRGRVAEWDVVNEALDDDGSYRDNVWLQVIGPDYIDHAFRFAREADPAARLYYNDAGIDLVDHPHTQGALRMLSGLRARGVPVDGMGLQGHVTLIYRATGAQFAETMRRFTALGLDVAVTEMEVNLDVPGAPGDVLEAQRAVYGDYARACREEPRCTSFSTWGISDLHAWRVDQHPEWRPLMFDEAFAAKPALATVRYWIAEP